jgi:Putative beta-barrel porin-2, OmpL-like. bbp2
VGSLVRVLLIFSKHLKQTAMVKNIKLLIIVMGSFFYAHGQDSTKTAAPPPPPPAKVDSVPPSPATTFSGSLDLYYRYNFANAPGFNNNYTSFTNSQNSFELGMATIRADHSWSKAGVTVELGFGRRAQEFSYNEAYNTGVPGGSPTTNFSLANVVQAFVYYNLTDKIKLTAGKWGTHIGYEVVDAAANRNYSMGYMFSFGPFYNMGLKADVTLSSKTAFMVGISNPTDNTTTMSQNKMFIAQFSVLPNSNWKFYLNYQGGTTSDTSSLNQFDLVINGTISPKFGIGFNATDQTRKYTSAGNVNWWGAALYLNWDPSSLFGLTLRSEYFDDNDNVVTPGSFSEFTLTGAFHLGKLTFMPELRLDDSKNSQFLKHDDTQTNSTFSAIFAATYVF